MYETKGGRVKGSILFFVSAIVYLILSVLIVRGSGLERIESVRFLFTIPQGIILALGGIKLLRTAEKPIGKVIAVVYILLGVVMFNIG